MGHTPLVSRIVSHQKPADVSCLPKSFASGSFSIISNKRFTALLSIAVVLFAVGMAQPALSQEWSGDIELSYGWMDTTGNPDAFRTQYNLESGFSLDQFDLDYRGEGGLEHFSINAWGFGDAEPAERFNLGLEFAPGLQIELDYRSNESFFGLGENNFPDRQDQWDLSRWRGTVTWTGWENWTLALEMRRIDREGTVIRPYYGLNELYPSGLDLDETMAEIGIRVETTALPVRLVFEQTYAEFERKNRPYVDGSQAISNPYDPDFFADLGSTAVDKQEVPTSSLIASWGNNKWEGVASALYSKSDLDAPGSLWATYDIGGGSIGTTSYIDEVVGSAQMDSMVGALRLGFKIGSAWTLRLGGSYRDASADSALLGRRLLRTVSPNGQTFEFEAPVDQTGYYDFTNSDGRLTLDWHGKEWSVWGGVFMAQRDVDWRLTTDGSQVKVKRDTDGLLGGISWASQSGIDASIEYESGSFERYVFRTDPEKVDRATARLRAPLGKGWKLDFHGRYEQADNPSEVAALDRDSKAHGLGLFWASSQGKGSFGLNVDQVQLDSNVDLVLPDGESGVSIYDLDLLTATLFGQGDFDRFHLHGSATYSSDSGDTWPIAAWNAYFRLGYDLGKGTRLGAFVQYWDYNEDEAEIDDFTAVRYGLSLRWSFNR